MIKAIIFDCFGVLASDGWLPFKQKYFGDDHNKFEEAGQLNYLADSGKINRQQFNSQIAELAGMSEKEVIDEQGTSFTNTPIFGLISELKKSGYKIGMLSNVSGDWLDKLFTEEQISLFDALALSFETKVAKPDKRAYEIICERLVCSPGETLFIDDQDRYVVGAVDAGLQAIVYKSLEQLKSDLDKILKY